MCYAYLVTSSRYEQLDELLTRIAVARQRPNWRDRILGGSVTSASTVRVLRAVEQCRQLSGGASIREVADFLAVEHSTASRSVAAVVAAGLVAKASAADDQRRCTLVLTDEGRHALESVADRRTELVAEMIADWSQSRVDALVELLDSLTERFERVAAR
ncbi:MarR family winged helix-turn-helix transcriptional regulator [Mycobacterium sp. E740]|uniref:MarR family winged helix-turn-helix transcriptional regulator n=1 Tax=Mycobacterium sp. E740 TaxID=1834149 RepID=UPI0007FCE919|nr:MarR family winged helix-turn-helix transcriptional regulator [Mycobacterium sp. E740]OBI76149.1 MarR family transcriptional regulator [Mycobacterium sp. E740]